MGQDAMRGEFEALFKRSYGRILPPLIRLAGDFGHAEDALQRAFESAWSSWEGEAWPQRPEAWLLCVAKRRLLDERRRSGRMQPGGWQEGEEPEDLFDEQALERLAEEHGLFGEDDSLRLIFTCCHPALAQEAQVALTLNSLCGLTAAEIGAAFLVSTSSMAQRLVRVKAKIKDARIPFRVPPAKLLNERLPSVLKVFYLIFSTGYSAPSGEQLLRIELCEEAIRLTRLLLGQMPDEPELKGLLALMLLQHGRAPARLDAGQELVLLEHQERARWDAERLEEGHELLMQALRMGAPGAYQLQAAIAGVHAQAKRYEDTDWLQILLLYGRLQTLQPSPVVELNRAVALSMARGPAEGLELVEQLVQEGSLETFSYLHSTRAELLERLDRKAEAAEAWGRALGLADNQAQRSFLQRRLDALAAS